MLDIGGRIIIRFSQGDTLGKGKVGCDGVFVHVVPLRGERR
jgi:hypothetical protein